MIGRFIFDLCLCFLSALFHRRSVFALPFAEHVQSRGAVNGGGHFEPHKTSESATRAGCGGVCNFKYIVWQYKSNAPTAQMADSDSLNTNGKVHIQIHLTKMLIWLLSCRLK